MKNDFYKTAITFMIVFLSTIIITTTAFAQIKPAGIEYPQSINLGKIPENIPAKATFTIKNTGNAPMVIENVMTTCGCTIANYTKKPITKGNTGNIQATYSAAQGKGRFTKTLYVKFSTVSEAQPITITGEVVTAKNVQKAI